MFTMHVHQNRYAYQAYSQDHYPADYLIELTHKLVDNGLDMYVGHGNHTIQGVEIYKGRPIFYNLGNFAVQRWGQSDSAPTGDGMTMIERAEGDGTGTFQQYINLVAIVAQSTYQDGILQEVRLYPVDLGVDRAERPWSQMSIPRTPSPALAHKILTEVQDTPVPSGRKSASRTASGLFAFRPRPQFPLVVTCVRPSNLVRAEPAEDVGATSEEPRPHRSRRWRWISVVGLLFFGTAILWQVAWPRGERPVADPYAGAEACASCHQSQHAAWRASTHGRAGGDPVDVALIAPFNGPPIVFADASVRPITDAAGRAAFVVAWRDEPAETLTVEGVVGGGLMAGGGTQGFFTRMRDGTVRFLPFDYSRQLGQWFCRSQPDGHWLPITPEKMLASCTDWPPRRTLGAVEGAAGCDQCHGSQVAVTFASDRKTWVTGYASLAINCESCHGPARRHVDLAESGRLGSSPDIGVPPLGRLGKRESVLICLQCHGEKLALDRTGTVLVPQALEDRVQRPVSNPDRSTVYA